MSDQRTGFQQLLDEQYLAREARAEKISCLVWLLVVLLTYVLFLLFVPNISPELRWNITLLVAMVAPAFGIVALLIQLGIYSPRMMYINTFFQVTLVSGAILFDAAAEGPQYALSSMPPLGYSLVVLITAFRLQPWLGIFAGVIGSAEFLLLYLFIIKPPPELVAAVPSLGLEVTLMKVVLILGMGVVAGLAAGRMRGFLGTAIQDAVRTATLERSFGRFISRDVARQLLGDSGGGVIEREAVEHLADPHGERIAARQAEAVIVFGDIRGFTNYSRDKDPAEVAELLNQFFEIVVTAVEAEGGMVNKFMGDGYLAFFGLFDREGEPCQAAARAILRIEAESEPLLGPRELRPGAAANRGQVMTGELGSKGRCEFTAIGAAVNLTSRLEGLNATLGTTFLASQAFVERLDPKAYTARSTGAHLIKGYAEPVETFEVRSA